MKKKKMNKAELLHKKLEEFQAWPEHRKPRFYKPKYEKRKRHDNDLSN